MKKTITILAFFIFFIGFSQHNKITIEDAVLGYYKGLYPKSLANLQWVTKTTIYVFEEENELVFFDAKTNTKVGSVTLESLKNTYPNLTRFPRFMEVTESDVTFMYKNTIERFNYKTSTNSTLTFSENAENVEFNSIANAVAFTLENNLFIANSTQSKIPVTQIEDKNIVSGQAIHRSEFGIHKGTFWSSNGNYLAFYQKNESNVSNYPLVDVTTYPASLKNIKYPMAGQLSEQAKIGIFNLKTQETNYLDIDTSDEHYLTNLTWTPDEKYILLAEINREQNHYWVNLYNIETGKKVRTLFEEKNEKWVEPEFDAVFLPNSNTNFLWLSEQNGFMNIFEYSITGKFVKQHTNFNWVVTGILGFDENSKNVFITGTGKDPREEHTFKVNLKNGKYTQITLNNGTHFTKLNSNGNYLLDTYSSLSTPNNIALIETKKGKSKDIFSAENPLINKIMGTTEFLTLKNADSINLYCRIIKPVDFDPSKKYPVLIYVYGGPHAQMVTNTWLGGANLWMNAFADQHNYIVFTLDNRGSANRGFEFESSIHRNLGDAEIEDQLVGVDFLKSLPYVDSNRLSLNGWSYGGFMTTSMFLRNPGMFTTAVAGGPVTDWKYYEVMYGERYMDTPQENSEGYSKAKVHNYIKDLKGKLLIIHGSVDPVVVPQHSMTLLQEAVKYNVPIDFFTYPMHEHNVRGIDRVHLIEKMMNYIVENNK